MRVLSDHLQSELTKDGVYIATKNDLEDILKLQKLAYQENAVRYNDFSIPPLTQTLEDLKEDSESSIILKVVEDRIIVGSVRAFEKDGSCHIGRVIVHPGYQNKGIGKKLMKAMEKCFEGRRFELFTGHLDEKNLAFYEKLGYKRFKEEKIHEGLRFVYFEKYAESGLAADRVEFILSEINEIRELIETHIESLSYPMDSWIEDRMVESSIYKIMYNECFIGYAGQIKETLHFFHIIKKYFKYAPAILETFIEKKGVKRVFVMTQDSMLCALMAEWDYDKEKVACWFTDSGRENENVQTSHTALRTACLSDIEKIRIVCGDFFEEPSGGFSTLEERVEAKTIFVLENNEELQGCGIVEKGQFCKGVTSIGMFVNREYRRKGAAKTILINLKDWAYNNNLKPVAGCWYYNTLSRKSLESAGMIATSIGYEAILKGKEKLPLRCGNPPGELVE